MRLRPGWIIFCGLVVLPVGAAGQSVDDLPDLTGGAVPVVFYKGKDPFSSGELTTVSRIQFEVRVKNQTGDPLIGETLYLVVDRIVEISGRDVSDRVKVLGYDGRTADGKPYFRIPTGNKRELPPYAESEPIIVELNNPDYLRFFPPTLTIRGLRRTAEQSVKDLLDTLLQKGLITPEEAQRAFESPTSSP